MTVEVDDNPMRRRGVALTVSVLLHALLILFLILYKIITPIPPFEESTGGGNGLELALGTDMLGKGDNVKSDQPSPPPSEQPPPSPQKDEALLTSNTDENPPVTVPDKKDTHKTEANKTKPKQTQADKDKQFTNKLNNLWNTHGSGETGHGASDTPGNAGGATGSPTGNGIGNGTGSYRGDGWSVDLAGRNIRKRPVINDKPSVAGKVVLDIWVDADGKVVRVAQNLSKSTTLDQTLFTIAKRAALESSFYPNPKATAEQKGSMAFTFDLE